MKLPAGSVSCHQVVTRYARFDLASQMADSFLLSEGVQMMWQALHCISLQDKAKHTTTYLELRLIYDMYKAANNDSRKPHVG